jgi:hypothetical protein
MAACRSRRSRWACPCPTSRAYGVRHLPQALVLRQDDAAGHALTVDHNLVFLIELFVLLPLLAGHRRRHDDLDSVRQPRQRVLLGAPDHVELVVGVELLLVLDAADRPHSPCASAPALEVNLLLGDFEVLMHPAPLGRVLLRLDEVEDRPEAARLATDRRSRHRPAALRLQHGDREAEERVPVRQPDGMELVDDDRAPLDLVEVALRRRREVVPVALVVGLRVELIGLLTGWRASEDLTVLDIEVLRDAEVVSDAADDVALGVVQIDGDVVHIRLTLGRVLRRPDRVVAEALELRLPRIDEGAARRDHEDRLGVQLKPRRWQRPPRWSCRCRHRSR